MKPSRTKKKVIEITRWKVGDAEDFQSLEREEDYDIESSPPECYEDEVNNNSEMNYNITHSITKYRIHPSPHLVTAYRDRPFQGQHPKEASVIFFGIDANYAADIEDDNEFFNILLDYHNDGVAYWKNNIEGQHHPFLSSLYKGRVNREGFLYHDTFRNIDLPKNPCADAISFVELLNVPTTGKLSEDNDNEFERLLSNSMEHLREIQDCTFDSENKLVFMPNEVIEKLKVINRKTGMFDKLNYKFVKATDMPIIYRNNKANISIYKIFHFSSHYYRSKVLAQGKVIRKIIMDFLK